MYHAADRLLLNDLAGTVQTGLYTIGVQIGQAISLVANIIGYAWSPYFFSLMTDNKDTAKMEAGRFSTYWVLAICFIFLVICVFSREIIALLVAAPYREAYQVVPLLSLGFLFAGLYYVVVNQLFWLGKTHIIAAGNLTSGALNVLLNLALIPSMQMMGSALATAISSLYCFLFIGFFSIKLFPLPYEYSRLAKIAITTAICYLLSLAVTELGDFWIVFAAKLPIIPAYFLILLPLRFYKADELAAGRKLVTTAISRLNHMVSRG
jgi:O-antigen/teichoic acid export membrane protein